MIKSIYQDYDWLLQLWSRVMLYFDIKVQLRTHMPNKLCSIMANFCYNCLLLWAAQTELHALLLYSRGRRNLTGRFVNWPFKEVRGRHLLLNCPFCYLCNIQIKNYLIKQQALCLCANQSSCQTSKSILQPWGQFELHAVWLQARICEHQLHKPERTGVLSWCEDGCPTSARACNLTSFNMPINIITSMFNPRRKLAGWSVCV